MLQWHWSYATIGAVTSLIHYLGGQRVIEGGPMATEQTNKPAHLDPLPLSPKPPALWSRPLAVATAIVFLISSAFPVTAGLSNNTAAFPQWWGILDVGIAFVLAILAFVIQALAGRNLNRHAEDASYR